MKNKQIKIMELLINKEDINKSVAKTITMDNNYLFEIYSIYKEKPIEEIAQNIIKVHLPEDMEKAKDLLLKGFTYNGVKYVSLLTTPGLMKQEDSSLAYKCDYFFINKEDEAFKEELENVASCGKLKDLKGKEIAINKDIVSRLGLLLSSGQMVYFDKPLKMAVLPECHYKHIGNYLQFAEKKVVDEDGKERSVIDLEDLRLEQHPNLAVSHTANDGSGFAMPHVMEEISKQLNKGYDINWCVIRSLGNASKGLIVRFDWKEYLRQEHGLESLIVKDMWGHDVDLFDVDIVVNGSLIKWGKLYNSYDEMIEARKDFPKYESLFNSLCITKFNKKEPKQYSETSYQLLSNLNLTPNELRELAKEDFETFKLASIDRNIDTIRILLGDWARDEEEVESKSFNASTKIHQILQYDEQMKSIETAQYTINNMLNKKINNFAGAKIHVPGNYKVICQDVFSYFDSLINPNYEYDEDGKLKGINGAISKNGLSANTNYVPGETGLRTLARSPLNSATEILRSKLVENELYDKYFKDFASDIIFFPFSDSLMRMSGADTDGDICLVTSDSIIYNSVIEDIDENGVKWNFRNQFDGKADKRTYNDENLIDCVLETAGNSIGFLSNYGAKISNLIQSSCMVAEGKLEDYNALFKKYKEKYKVADYEKARQEEDPEKRRDLYIKLKKEFEETILEHNKNNGFKTEPSEADYKEFCLKKFQEHKLHSYYLLYLQMVAIDSVKSCVKVDKSMLEPLNKLGLKDVKKPLYIYYAKYKSENKAVEYEDVQYSASLLNNFAKEVIGEIGSNARSKNKPSNTHLFTVLTKAEEEKGVTVSEELESYIKEIYTNYSKLVKLIKEDVEKLKAQKSKLKNEYEIEAINRKLEREEEIRNNKLNELEVMVFDKITRDIRNKYTTLELLLAVGKARDKDGNKLKSKFIFDFFFEELKSVLIENAHGLMSVYALTEEETDDNIHVLYKDYKKINKSIEGGINLSKESIAYKKVKLGQAIETRIGGLKDTENLEGIELFGIKYTTYKKKDKEGNEEIKDQLQVIVQETVEDKIKEKMIGYIYNDKAEGIELDKKYRIIYVKPGNSSKISATVIIEEVK